MGIEISIRPATELHARSLAVRMRAEDREELRAVCRKPLAAVLRSIRLSEESYTALFDGRVAAIFGVRRVGPSSLLVPQPAAVWMLTAAPVSEHRFEFLRASRELTNFLGERYPVLFNYIDARYTAAIRWARFLGFEVEEAAPYGPNGAPFCLAVRRRF